MGSGEPSNSRERDVGISTSGILHWVLFKGHRLALTGIVLLAVFLVLVVLTTSRYFAVGGDSMAGSLFTSGLTSGVLTVVTLILSINQLILSRLFGSPGNLSNRLEGTREFRRQLERIAEVPSTPNDPAAFLALIGATIERRARGLRADLTDSTVSVDAELLETLEDVRNYGDRVEHALEPETPISQVLDVLLATEYARKMTTLHEMNNVYGEGLTPRQADELGVLQDLFGMVAITRHFFKTLALQENFARLSRIIAVTGLAAFCSTVSLSLLYRSSGVTIDPGAMPLVVSVGLTVIFAPVVAVIVYVLRAATVARHTVSVGPFVPPGS